MGIELYLTVFIAGALAASINAVAGGGPILTLGILSFTGIDPRIANLTSTVALCPGQLAAGHAARAAFAKTLLGRPKMLAGIALVGGAAGAALLMLTSSAFFNDIVPWLVLVATGIYAWSGSGKGVATRNAENGRKLLPAYFAPLAIYGGYFGGGNSFLVLALLGLAGHGARDAGEVKNALIAVVNLGAVLVLAFSGLVDWKIAAALGTGGLIGSMLGVKLLARMPMAAIRLLVITFGLCFAGWMFVR